MFPLQNPKEAAGSARAVAPGRWDFRDLGLPRFFRVVLLSPYEKMWNGFRALSKGALVGIQGLWDLFVSLGTRQQLF